MEVLCRLVRQHELDGTLSMILSTSGRPATTAHVEEFLHFAARRGIRVTDAWIAQIAGRLTWAALPIVSPGRTLLLFAAPLQGPPSIISASQVISRIAQMYAHRDVQLAQILLDPEDGTARRFYLVHGFAEMAELIYLNGPIPRNTNPPELASGMRWLTYSAATHDLFAKAILETYAQSLDCPGLNGLRDIQDVLQGHMATGEFHPDLWHVLVDSQQPLGVVLLSGVPNSDALELVYLGLSPRARGRGLGDLLMRQAFCEIARANRRRLTLAVDAHNTPALRLYYRHGLTRLTSKVAMIRDLRHEDLAANP